MKFTVKTPAIVRCLETLIIEVDIEVQTCVMESKVWSKVNDIKHLGHPDPSFLGGAYAL